jgi:ABC-type multidrug transport system ATPase subunit
LCTHNLAEAQTLCDRVAIIKRTVLRMGTPKQLQTSLYGRQVEFRLAVAGRPQGAAPTSNEASLHSWASAGSATNSRFGAVGDATESRPAHADSWASPTSGHCSERLNDLAVLVSSVAGVGDVSVVEDRLLVSMDDPDRVTPGIVRLLVNEGMDIMRVAEVEHSLERAYLDLVARQASPVPGPESRVPMQHQEIRAL